MRILTYNPKAGYEPKTPVTIEDLKLRDGVVVEVDVCLEANVLSTDGLEFATTAMVALMMDEPESRVEISCENVIADSAFLKGIAIDLASFAVTGQDNVARAYQAAIAQLLQEEAHVTIEPDDGHLSGDHPVEILVTIECRGQVFTGRTAWENVEKHFDDAD